MTITRDDRIALFTNLQNADTQPESWVRVAEDWASPEIVEACLIVG